jgi:hypothetical protein
MDMSLIHLAMLLWMLAPDVFAEPAYPPNTLSGGTVVAEMQFSSGSVQQIKLLSGEEPFASVSLEALENWNLHPDRNGVDLVILHFRQPNLYYIGSAGENISCDGVDPSLPCPNYIVGPAYPAHAFGEGSVILKVEIAGDGSILKVDTLKGLGSLTDVSVEAVRKWKFSPAQNPRGGKTESAAYVVFVYPTPVVSR